MADKDYEAIVLGVGGMGAAALHALARRGVRACGVEQHAVGHDRGSSHGQTRAIRIAYFEHPDYLPLLQTSYSRWDDLGKASGRRLRIDTGILFACRPGGVLDAGFEAFYGKHDDMPRERWLAGEMAEHYPQLTPPAGSVGWYDPLGAALLVDDCVRTLAEQAVDLGADIRAGRPVAGWKTDGNGVRVAVGDEELTADRLIVTAGAWSSGVLGELGLPLRVARKVVAWYEPDDAADLCPGELPIFYFETDAGEFYAFPSINADGIKAAEHTSDTFVRHADDVDRDPREGDDDRLRRFLDGALPGRLGRRTRWSICMYTHTPDENFIIDRVPGREQVAFAAGLSGHGFKFAPVIGEALADLACDGATDHPIGFLSLRRFNKL